MFCRILRFLRNVILVLFLLSVLSVIIYRFAPVYYTPLMAIRSIEALKNGKILQNKKTWVKIGNISPMMIRAVVASEDNLFMQHSGFSVDDIKKAMNENKKGRRLRGGSTISQQTAKNVFLWPKRSYARKALEAYFTLLIELFWSKERIMEVYLNVIETGNGIYGVEAAAKHYFRASASALSKSQSALIAVCLPNPRKYNPAKPSQYILKRQYQIMNLMGKIGTVDLKKKKDKK
ncbi:MAG: monofunctional biosynthetic peptidoglycan transglycosylase [Prevotellaceae bacterium]|jgi:monofunctional biosynthetic peptidoglycan transglycosylase|nr:monofunctional biosynthetic peptidoglycan transglycosylase [Prevotellaceae bacterium]